MSVVHNCNLQPLSPSEQRSQSCAMFRAKNTPDNSTCNAPVNTSYGYGSTTGWGGGGGSYPNGLTDNMGIGSAAPNCPKKYKCIKPSQYCKLSPTARIVISIAKLNNVNGSTLDEISTYYNTIMCPSVPLTSEQINTILKQGVSSGVFYYFRSTRSYKVNGFFGSLPSNLKLLEELGPRYQTCLGLFCDKK